MFFGYTKTGALATDSLFNADVAKLVDAPDLGSGSSDRVKVRFLSSAQTQTCTKHLFFDILVLIKTRRRGRVVDRGSLENC